MPDAASRGESLYVFWHFTLTFSKEFMLLRKPWQTYIFAHESTHDSIYFKGLPSVCECEYHVVVYNLSIAWTTQQMRREWKYHFRQMKISYRGYFLFSIRPSSKRR